MMEKFEGIGGVPDFIKLRKITYLLELVIQNPSEVIANPSRSIQTRGLPIQDAT